MSTSVIVADGHWLIRAGLRAALQPSRGLEIVGEAGDAASAIILARQLQPALMLVDLHLPPDGGVAAARAIREACADQKVLLLCDAGGETHVRDALRAGCAGVARKDLSDKELIEAVHCIRDGGVYVDAEMSRRLVLLDHQREVSNAQGPLDGLSERELAVFRLIGRGSTNRAAGESLNISPKTVEKYRASLMRKLRLGSAVDLRMLAVQLGLATHPHADRTSLPDSASRGS
jgi:DNA-binding NarL/FixJ family response regulator